ncbi:cupin domain-containing protein [Shewanella submarina]|uniref:Cupin domain-containing protein n=1 Tax=Shewanella submarina TaxID=2016376 RepID=A0ABV7GFX0_9GAMM|nr:AraC family transcriptional regulator [Shewanella submarina]
MGDMFDVLKLRGSIFFHSSLAAPWGMSLPAIKAPRFHISMEGNFVVGSGEQVRDVSEMNIALLPQGGQHWIADMEGRELAESEAVIDACKLHAPLFQHGEVTNRVICGMVEYEELLSHPMLEAMPEILVAHDISHDEPLWQTVCLIDSEIRATGNLRSPIIDRLSEILFILLAHRCMKRDPSPSGFVAALRNPRLSQVLAHIHRDAAAPWTLSSLAATANMSAATLVRHFNTELGMSPIQYVTQWRLNKAFQLIQHSRLPLDLVADKVGFATGKSLSRAFIRQFGFPPGDLRKPKPEQTGVKDV